MIGIYASAALILVLSLLFGRAILLALGARRPTWLAGAVGFSALLIAAPLLIRLPGRAVTAAIAIGLAAIVCLVVVRRTAPGAGTGNEEGTRPVATHTVALLAVLGVLAMGSIPFAVNGEDGPLGKGIYTNDQGAQLYWGDWLQEGVGPQPKAVRFGYPTGPQALAATAAEATGTSLERAFNGLLLAIPALTALVALRALGGLAPGRRLLAALLCALPYLGAAFLAQSGFKETAMALLLLAFALWLGESRELGSRRAKVVPLGLFALAGAFAFSIPAFAWFALALVVWLGLEVAHGRRPGGTRAIREAIKRHRRALAVAGIATLVLVGIAATQLGEFAGRLDEVRDSAGRLASPVFPGEALGIWPEGDFRIVRGEVDGSLLATAIGAIGVLAGALLAWRAKLTGLLAGLIAGVAAYAGARAVAGIHVEAKALAIVAPVVMLVVLRGLLAAGDTRVALVRQAFGALFAALALISTFLALREAPVGFGDRSDELAEFRSEVAGEQVLFLGVDRFAPYDLRGAERVASPGGYVPEKVKARKGKVWQQGQALDFDSVATRTLNRFLYVITTKAAYASREPFAPGYDEVQSTRSFRLWRRTAPATDSEVLERDDEPAARLDCRSPLGRHAIATGGDAELLPVSVLGESSGWNADFPLEAPARASQTLTLDSSAGLGGLWDLSLQYHSQVGLKMTVAGKTFDLPPSLDGMYLSAPGQGAFWRASGYFKVRGSGATRVEVSAEGPSGFAELIGAPRYVWLGAVAATPFRPELALEHPPINRACGEYIDRYAVSPPE